MPVETAHFNRRVIFTGKIAVHRAAHQVGQVGHAAKYVQTVQTGHHEVDAKKNVRVCPFNAFERIEFPRQQAFVDFVAVLEILDHHEGCGAQDGDKQENHGKLAIVKLHASDRQSNGQRTDNENRCVNRAHCHVEVQVRIEKHVGVPGAIDGVSAKQPAEKQDFRQQENPQAEFRGFLLLLNVYEMML